ncbi:MAG: hypothetical protein OEZ41_00340 [Nitrospirota bacterium]|nr:hypothetical protein [Nitrospirota bacterium]MDH5698395.1 hypothetical protein [Nitrospirota bacterium]
MTHAQLEDAGLFPFRRRGLVGSLRFCLTLLVMGFMMMGASKGCVEAKPTEPLAPAPQSISVYALSRGKGVPDQAREVLAQSRTLLKAAQERGEVLRVVEQRIGIEGETRLCAEFSPAESARTIFDQIQQLGQGVDLLNVKVEPCPP